MPDEFYSPNLVKLKKSLARLRGAFVTIKKSGMDEEILLAYLKDKTGCSKKTLKAVMAAEEDFYMKLQKMEEDGFLEKMDKVI